MKKELFVCSALLASLCSLQMEQVKASGMKLNTITPVIQNESLKKFIVDIQSKLDDQQSLAFADWGACNSWDRTSWDKNCNPAA